MVGRLDVIGDTVTSRTHGMIRTKGASLDRQPADGRPDRSDFSSNDNSVDCNDCEKWRDYVDGIARSCRRAGWRRVHEAAGPTPNVPHGSRSPRPGASRAADADRQGASSARVQEMHTVADPPLCHPPKLRAAAASLGSGAVRRRWTLEPCAAARTRVPPTRCDAAPREV